MSIAGIRFVTSATAAAGFPALPSGVAEVALAGRSNVGKSSLLNALVRRRGLARVSKTPGRTQMVNFFNWQNRLSLVDLPGYGYARAPRGAVRAWTHLTATYLAERVELSAVVMLINAEHGIKPADAEFVEFLAELRRPVRCVLTKVDRIPSHGVEPRRQSVEEALVRTCPVFVGPVVAASSKTGVGLAEVRDLVHDAEATG